MDFDKPKVYGDTFISDGLVQFLETSMRMTPGAGLGRTLGPRQAAPTCLSMVMVMVMVQAVVM